MTLHDLFGSHIADPHGNRWDDGLFVSACQICGKAMVKPPGQEWKLLAKKRPI